MKKWAVLVLCLALTSGFSAAAMADARKAPGIPPGDFAPQAGWMLPEGRYPVYTGPGEDYVRAGNGKALLSTKGWVQVFGWDAGWVLVQYGVSKAQMRMGYVRVPGLMRDGPLRDMEMVWTGGLLAVKGKSAFLTDDPLASQAALAPGQPGDAAGPDGGLGLCGSPGEGTEDAGLCAGGVPGAAKLAG